MKFTIFGATGFVGRFLSTYLINEGHEVYAPNRGDVEIFNNKLGHVIYCIGLTADFRTRPFDTVRAHVSVLADVLEKGSFESLVYLSSTRVYGRSSIGNEQASLLVDSSDPSDLYNLSKLTGESLCLACGLPKIKVVRLSNIVGYDSDSENFMMSLIRDALSGKVVLKSHPSSSKDYILLKDVALLLSKIALEGEGRIYNLASGVNLRHSEVLNVIRNLTGCEVEILQSAPLLEFPVIDVNKIKNEFNFSPEPVLENLADLVLACRENLNFK